MSFELLPDGAPGEHLGIGHTLKHFLDPAECWGDVSAHLPESVQPHNAALRLPDEPFWSRWKDPSDGVIAEWEWLRNLYRCGYADLVQATAEALDVDTLDAERWVVRNGTWRAIDEDQGICLVVVRRGDNRKLYTAFRPDFFPYKNLSCPPRDAANVSLRRKLSVLRARKLMARWRGEEQAQ